MDLKLVKNSVTSKVGRQILIGKKHSPAIMFGVGVVGMIGTTVLACRATLKVDTILDEAEAKREVVRGLEDDPRYSEKDRDRDLGLIKINTARRIAQLYVPAVALGVVSCASLTGSHVVLTRRNAAVMAAYATLDQGFKEYRERVRNVLGEDEELSIRNDVHFQDVAVQNEKGETKVVNVKTPGEPSIYARFFDECSPSWQPQPEYNLAFLKAQQCYANDLLHARGHVFLNEIYDSLGIPRTKAGAVVGWVISKDGDNFVDFGLYDKNGQYRGDFINGREASVLLDFNVDGVIYDKI
jgi:hypothetical protein